jgi:hypothetical protein
MVAGSIGLIGQTWTVTAQLVDVETARTDRTSSHSHAGSIDGLLDVLGDVARELAGGRRDVVIRPEDTGTIVVTSTPAGATISVDGVEKGTTPVSAEVSAGMHAVTASYPGYRSETKGVYVEAGGWVPVTIDMAKLAGNVRVITDPAGALVRVNGVLRGESSETGLVVADLPSGQTHISASKEGRKDASTTVEVVGGEETRVELKLKRKKSLWEYALYATGALMVLSLVTLIAVRATRPNSRYGRERRETDRSCEHGPANRFAFFAAFFLQPTLGLGCRLGRALGCGDWAFARSDPHLDRPDNKRCGTHTARLRPLGSSGSCWFFRGDHGLALLRSTDGRGGRRFRHGREHRQPGPRPPRDP